MGNADETRSGSLSAEISALVALSGQKKTPELGVGMGKSRSKLHTFIPGQKYLFGIGDQTLDITKGLKVISSDVTIGASFATLKPAFVNICEPFCHSNTVIT